ncbi:hypothetical protein F4861DRAFT_544511 [Xylaria intraflava]|nr:hypothetical protein F4861DRAFT_544511 [Xylaria intraflava]
MLQKDTATGRKKSPQSRPCLQPSQEPCHSLTVKIPPVVSSWKRKQRQKLADEISNPETTNRRRHYLLNPKQPNLTTVILRRHRERNPEIENWVSYYNTLQLAMDVIGHKRGKPIEKAGESILAQTIASTCTQSPLNLINGLRKGSEMIDLFSRTYATSSKIYRESTWEKFSSHKYDGKDPVEFSTKWLRLLMMMMMMY